MTERTYKLLFRNAAITLLIATAIAGIMAGGRGAFGVFCGGAWNLVNLWCLIQLLQAWLGPVRSTRRVVGFVVIKFLFLYLLVFALLRHPDMSLAGFAVGFTMILASAVATLAWHARQLVRAVSHER